VKNKLFLAALAVLVLPSLAACGSTGEEELATSIPDMFPEIHDPSDSTLRAAIGQYLAESKGPTNSQYEYVRADLNGDGLREGLVMFNLPHSYWCGWSGCTMAVFQASDNNFTMISQTSKIRGPVVIGDTQTNGWDDIGVRVSGTQNADKNVLLQFDGTGYPASPLDDATLPYDVAWTGGTKLFP